MDLQDKIRKIEALIASSKNEGEVRAAELAKNRILDRQQKEFAEKPIEYKMPCGDLWKKKLFVALCNKHQIRTYRYKGQKYTTAMLRISPAFADNVLVPEFKKYLKLLEDLVDDILCDLINQIHEVKEEEVEIAGELS